LKKILYLYIPSIFSIYILVNLTSLLLGSQICESSGCKIVDSLTKIEPLYLNILGALFSFTLIFLGFKYLKTQKEFYQNSFKTILFTGFLFESILIIFQLTLLDSICYFCFGVYAFITILALLTLKPLNVIFAFIALFIAFNTLKFIPYNSKLLDKDNSYYIFSSEDCKHCKNLKKYLIEKEVKYIKKDVTKIENTHMLSSFNIKTIPTLFAKTNKGFDIVVGDEKIIEYLESKNSLDFSFGATTNSFSNFNFSNDTATNNSGDGCSITEICE